MSETLTALVLAGLVGIVLSGLFFFTLLGRRTRAAFQDGLQRQAERANADQQLLEERLDAKGRDNVRLDQALKVSAQALAVSEEENRRLLAENAALFARLEETTRAFAEKEALFKETGASLKQEFQLLANRIFEEQGQSFARNNRAQIDGLLTPFREQISEFKQRVEQVYHTESKDRASLLTEVRNLHRASDKINQEAENLAKALKGDKRLRATGVSSYWNACWTNRGCAKTTSTRCRQRDAPKTATRKRPDVIIHLPDDKDIIVDSKVSLAAYERAVAAEDDGARENFLRQHVNDLRAQVKRLSEQEYDRLLGVRSLDFVLLFVPIESAFMLAMDYDQGLFTEAFNKRIVIVSPTTLLMTLRIIHNVWRYEKQTKNAQEIARRAGALYDKLRLVMEDMAKLGSLLRTADESYQTAMLKLASGKGNLVRQVEHFRELGASVRRPFPRELLDTAEDASELDPLDAVAELTLPDELPEDPDA
jgi:DNA recombination protein RmuC